MAWLSGKGNIIERVKRSVVVGCLVKGELNKWSRGDFSDSETILYDTISDYVTFYICQNP